MSGLGLAVICAAFILNEKTTEKDTNDLLYTKPDNTNFGEGEGKANKYVFPTFRRFYSNKNEEIPPHFSCVGFISIFTYFIISFFKKFYLFIFRAKGREGEREREKRQCVVASCETPAGDLDCNPGMYPDWELNW